MPTETGAASGAERVEEHNSKQRERGLQLVRVWVPTQDVRRLRDQAKEMRAEAGLPLPTDNALPFPGWAYVRLRRDEQDLRKEIKQHGARWISEAEVWRIRADLISELRLQPHVVPAPSGYQTES